MVPSMTLRIRTTTKKTMRTRPLIPSLRSWPSFAFTTRMFREIPAEKNLGRRNQVTAQRMIRICVPPFVHWPLLGNVVLTSLASCQPRSLRPGNHYYIKNVCNKSPISQRASRARRWKKGRTGTGQLESLVSLVVTVDNVTLMRANARWYRRGVEPGLERLRAFRMGWQDGASI